MRRDEPGAPDRDPGAREAGHDLPSVDPDRKLAEEQLQALARQRRARVVKAAVALAILIILIIFVIANSQPVPVDFVFLTRHPRLIWVMITCAVLGGILGYLLGRPGKQIRLRRKETPGRPPSKPS
jgi:uncharacterized integral membrane protein